MIVTTSTRGQSKLDSLAQEIAQQFQLYYVKRGNHSITDLMQDNQVESLIMVTTEGVKFFLQDQLQDPFFFHPSSAMFRLKRLLKGEHDPFIEATQLVAGMSFLDATLGLASDSIIASYQVGTNGRVVGIESVPLLSFIVQLGLKSWESKLIELNEAMRRIEVIRAHHQEYLMNLPSSSFDIVYFDPMFERSKEDSLAIAPLKKLANYQRLNLGIIQEAKRIARKRVVLKDSSYSTRFAELGFVPIQRKYASHWFGTIEVEEAVGRRKYEE